MTSRLGPPLFLLVLGLIFFAPLWLPPGRILYSDHSDLLSEHLPARQFLVRSFHETGEIPLWCPYMFCGSPFVHDMQVGIFYPPHWLLFLVRAQDVGVALSWLVVAHVILAGWAMYAYARGQNLGTPAALVAAIGYMFAGKWLLHLLGAGHYIVVGLAWLPLAALCLERAIRQASVLWGTAAGVFFALLILGTHPQWTFYAGLILALWTLGTALDVARVWQEVTPSQPLSSWFSKQRLIPLVCWLGFGVWAAVLAVTLAAIQLLPTMEAAGLSTRSATMSGAELLADGMRSLMGFFGPDPRTNAGNAEWEARGGFGVLWVAAALLAPLLVGGKVRYWGVLTLLLLLFSFGGSALLQGLPGFGFFRIHSRMLMLVSFPVSVLAGVTTQGLLSSERAEGAGRRVLVGVVLVFVVLVGGMAALLTLGRQGVRFHPYWVALLVSVPAAYWLLGRPASLGTASWAWLWGAVLVIDAVAIVWPLVGARDVKEVLPVSACVRDVKELLGPQERVLDRDVPAPAPQPPLGSETPLGAGAPVAVMEQIHSLRGYNPMDVKRYKEFLQMVVGTDRPVEPFSNPLTFPIMGNFPIENKHLLDMAGVRYLLQPSTWPVGTETQGVRRKEPFPGFPGGRWPLAPQWWEPGPEDPAPQGYDLVTGGLRKLPPYRLYRNRDAFPRAFLVPAAAPLPAREQVLNAMNSTDFRQTVLLEGYDFPQDKPVRLSERVVGETTFLSYQPNRVRLEVTTDGPAFLVLSDVWYPGWSCSVDGTETPLYRGNYLFRTVEVPKGKHEVAFVFLPESYVRGQLVSAVALGVVALIGLTAVGLWLVRRR